jgi:hypothetical protein
MHTDPFNEHSGCKGYGYEKPKGGRVFFSAE